MKKPMDAEQQAIHDAASAMIDTFNAYLPYEKYRVTNCLVIVLNAKTRKMEMMSTAHDAGFVRQAIAAASVMLEHDAEGDLLSTRKPQ